MNLKIDLTLWANSSDPKLLDLRSEINNLKCILFSTWIPRSDLAERWCELPPKIHPFAILVSENNSAELEQAHFIREKGWLVPYIFIGSDKLWQEAKALNLVVPLPIPYLPLKLLFSPSPFLFRWYKYIEETLLKNGHHKTLTLPNYKECIDIGCGSGRDLGWLGTQNKFWRFTGLDCVEKTLSRARLLLKNLGIPPSRSCFLNARFLKSGKIQVNSSGTKKIVNTLTSAIMESFGKTFFIGPEIKYDLVLCIRCLERESFSHLRNLVRPGGFLLFSTFVDGYPEYPYDHPSVESGMRLQRNELSKAFGTSFGFKVVSDIIELIEDGRPVNSFLAQKL